MYLLPLLTAIWCVGRLLFWIGYPIDPMYRAIGMDWTSGVLFTTAGLFLASLV